MNEIDRFVLGFWMGAINTAVDGIEFAIDKEDPAPPGAIGQLKQAVVHLRAAGEMFLAAAKDGR